MKLADKAARYARQHPQEVALSWVDKSVRIYMAEEAARLCGVPRIAACIMGAAASDKTLEDLLNRLIDSI